MHEKSPRKSAQARITGALVAAVALQAFVGFPRREPSKWQKTGRRGQHPTSNHTSSENIIANPPVIVKATAENPPETLRSPCGSGPHRHKRAVVVQLITAGNIHIQSVMLAMLVLVVLADSKSERPHLLHPHSVVRVVYVACSDRPSHRRNGGAHRGHFKYNAGQLGWNLGLQHMWGGLQYRRRRASAGDSLSRRK